jgi:hypothetical protein
MAVAANRFNLSYNIRVGLESFSNLTRDGIPSRSIAKEQV